MCFLQRERKVSGVLGICVHLRKKDLYFDLFLLVIYIHVELLA